MGGFTWLEDDEESFRCSDGRAATTGHLSLPNAARVASGYAVQMPQHCLSARRGVCLLWKVHFFACQSRKQKKAGSHREPFLSRQLGPLRHMAHGGAGKQQKSKVEWGLDKVPSGRSSGAGSSSRVPAEQRHRHGFPGAGTPRLYCPYRGKLKQTRDQKTSHGSLSRSPDTDKVAPDMENEYGGVLELAVPMITQGTPFARVRSAGFVIWRCQGRSVWGKSDGNGDDGVENTICSPPSPLCDAGLFCGWRMILCYILVGWRCCGG